MALRLSVAPSSLPALAGMSVQRVALRPSESRASRTVRSSREANRRRREWSCRSPDARRLPVVLRASVRSRASSVRRGVPSQVVGASRVVWFSEVRSDRWFPTSRMTSGLRSDGSKDVERRRTSFPPVDAPTVQTGVIGCCWNRPGRQLRRIEQTPAPFASFVACHVVLNSAV